MSANNGGQGRGETGREMTREEAVAKMKERMAADAKAPGGHVVYRRFRIGGFWTAAAATVVLLIMGLVVLSGIAARSNFDVLLFPALVLPAALVAAVVFASLGRGDIAGGIVAGLALVVVGLGITCFVAITRI